MTRFRLALALVAGTLIGLPAAAQVGDATASEGANDRPAADGDRSERPLVQIALLLDTSNSMDGLINQAKTELWSVVNELAMARANGAGPELQVALYQYGNNGLSRDAGWVSRELAFTDDLDAVSEKLFGLSTNGGQEYCGWVIRDATEQLEWSADRGALKMVVIAGNEGFDQGEVDFRSSVPQAIAKGVIVNTIFCGPDAQGRQSGWLEGAKLADGEYHSIDSDAAVAHIPAPQDDELVRLGTQINTTYVAFGAAGARGLQRQAAQDAAAESLAPAARVGRASAKASALYVNSMWDLVDAVTRGEVKLEDVAEEDLPEPMRAMSLEERQAHLKAKADERAAIQKRIAELQAERAKFVAERRKEMGDGAPTLGEALSAAIRKQARAKGMEWDK